MLTASQRRQDLLIEWTLGMILPVLIGGPVCARLC